MKRLKRRIYSATSPLDDKICFKPSEVVELLSKIDELKGKHISIYQTSTGNIQFIVGKTGYAVKSEPLEAIM